MDKLWLPEGHHWDLHIEHDRHEDAGTFTGGGAKILLHTTESSWESVDAMCDVLKAKRAAPHFVIGGRAGRKHPVVVQCVPLNRAGRALANDPADGHATNRANVIQIEICGRAAESHLWSVNRYESIANLIELIRHRVDVPLKAPPFSKPAPRMGDAAFVKYAGILGHCHAPDNNHWDPGRLRQELLLRLLRDMPSGGYDL